ncbi:MAG: TolC family protein [Bacteroidota bacterium]
MNTAEKAYICFPYVNSIVYFLLFGIFSLTYFSPTQAQESLSIFMIQDDDDTGTQGFADQIKTEIEALLGSRIEVEFIVNLVPKDPIDFDELVTRAYAREEGDIVIGVGTNSSEKLARKSEFSKPTILTIILDRELQGLPITEKGSSGIPNLSYIESPFDISRDFETLYEILPFEHITIIGGESLENNTFDFESYFQSLLGDLDATFTYVTISDGVETVLDNFPESAEAAYFLPIFDEVTPNGLKILLDELAAREKPAFSLFNTPMLEAGAYGAYDSDANIQRIPRRVALNVLKMYEGAKPEDIPVRMESFTENLTLNMKVVSKTGVFPSWDMMAEATLVNVDVVDTERELTLQSAISEGLENNLDLKVAEKETQISKKEVAVARGNYLPQVEGSSTLLEVDENTVSVSFGQRGRLNWSAALSATQLVFSEPALANIKIQNLLLESQRQSQKQTQLDVILDITDAYLNMLQASALLRLRNQNVSVTRKNFDIAGAKEQVGYAGTNDVYRWESELAQDNVDLNNAQAQLWQARYNMNVLLNRPVKEDFELADLGMRDSILLIMDERLFSLIDNPGDLDIFSDFLVEEAFRNLPEIKQLQYSIQAQRRSLQSQNRAFYLPSLGLSGEANYVINNYYYPEGVTPIELNTSNAALGLQFPIFQGLSRKNQRDQTKIGLMQLSDQMQNLRNQLEFLVRGNLRVAGASYSNMELSRISATAASKNFEIAQDNYSQGLLNVTSLIDAQNAALQAEINAISTEYIFIQDFLAVERAIGYFHFLAIPEEQDMFFQRFLEFLSK